MVLVEAAFVFGLAGLILYGIFSLLLRPSDQRRPSARAGTWRVAHYDADLETHVVLQKISEDGAAVLDEHAVATFRTDDPQYDEKFLAAMDTARRRQALFDSEEGG
jgi:hypothetical protein